MMYLAKLLVICQIFMLPSCNQAKNQCILMSLPSLTSTAEEEFTECIPEVNSTSKNDIFTLILTNGRLESGYNIVVDLISQWSNHSYHGNETCSEIIGVVGDIDSKTASILQTLASMPEINLDITVVAAVAPSTLLSVTNLSPKVLDMNPLSSYIEAIVRFIDQWNWTRVGLISDGSYYYQFAAEILLETLQKDSEKILTPVITINQPNNTIQDLRAFKEYDTHVVVVAMGQYSACSLIKTAFQLNLTWPDYAWIVLNDDLLTSSSTCSDIMDMIFVLTVKAGSSKCEQSCGVYDKIVYEKVNKTLSNYCGLSKFTALYDTLYDSILAVALSQTFGFISNSTYLGSTGLVKFRAGKRLNNISIVQVLDISSYREVACYFSELSQLNVLYNLSASGNFPQGNTKIVEFYSSKASIVVVSLLFIVILAFLTIILILYIYFRNEPEIKATSVAVSMWMFLGCYLMLLFVPFLLIETQPATIVGPEVANFICNVLLWTSAIGLPMLLILASLFIKMVRVYVIFINPHSYKKKFCSNLFLFLYIFIIMLPQLLILILFTATDTFENGIFEFTRISHIRIVEGCVSKHTIIWLCLMLTYIIIATIALTILAFKSSEIRYKIFTDTKATNAFTFLTIFIMVLGLTYWYFFRSLEPLFTYIVENEVTLYSAHFTLPVLCQLFLFVPKVYPPLKRHIFKSDVKSKSIIKSTLG